MRQALQQKINLLGIAFIVMFLLMLPAFSQVKADTRDSLKEAKNTLMVKWLRELTKDVKPPKDLSDVEVEDYWEEQAKKYDPECDKCGPDDDRDGDGMSNAEEHKSGRNPSCNEDKYGFDYCQNRDKYNLTDEDPVNAKLRTFLIRNLWLNRTDSGCNNGPVQSQCTLSATFEVPRNLTRLLFYLNVTQYSGGSWDFSQNSPSTGAADISNAWQGTRNGGFEYQPRTYAQPTASGILETPEAGNYRTLVVLQFPQTGYWNLLVYGVGS